MLPLTPAISQNLSTHHLLEPFAADYRNKLLDKKSSTQTAVTQSSNTKIEKLDAKKTVPNKKIVHDVKDKENGISVDDEWIDNPSFLMALSLFRANVITLCLRCDIEGSALWPHEAILLNLGVLHSKCIQEVNKSVLSTNKYKTKFRTTPSNLLPTLSDDIYFDKNCTNPLSGLIRRYESKRTVKINSLGLSGVI